MIIERLKGLIRKLGENKIHIAFVAIAIVAAILATMLPVHIEMGDPSNAVLQIGQGAYRITIGNIVNAQEADYTCDGSADDETFQTALNALPEVGGELLVLAGAYNWTASTTVTRAIDNVSIIGVGASATFDGDGATPIFTAGGNRWLFSNFRTDAGGLEMGETSNWMWLNIFISGTYYSIVSPGDALASEADLTTLEDTVTALQGDVTTLQSDLDTLESTVSSLSTTVEGHTTDISNLQSNVTTLQSDVSTLQSDLTTLEGIVSGHTTDISSLQSAVSTLQSDVTTLQSDVSTLQSDVDTLQSDVSTLQSDVATLQSTVSILVSDVADLQSRMITAEENIADLQPRSSDETVTVGPAGDFATINEAIAYLSTKYTIYKKGGYTVEVSLLSGFEMEEQVMVKGINLGWITITSEDAEVTIIRSALTIEDGYGRYPAFSAVNNGVLPFINALFDMDSSGNATNRDGITCTYNSRAIVASGAGIKNAGGWGIYARRGSTIVANGAVASGCYSNFHARHGSTLECRDSDATNATEYGILAHDVSVISAEGADASGAAGQGIYSGRGSIIDATDANAQMGASPSSDDIVVEDGGIIHATGATGGLSQASNAVTEMGIIFDTDQPGRTYTSVPSAVTYTIGSGQDYATVAEAVADIKSLLLEEDITLKLMTDVTETAQINIIAEISVGGMLLIELNGKTWTWTQDANPMMFISGVNQVVIKTMDAAGGTIVLNHPSPSGKTAIQVRGYSLLRVAWTCNPTINVNNQAFTYVFRLQDQACMLWQDATLSNYGSVAYTISLAHLSRMTMGATDFPATWFLTNGGMIIDEDGHIHTSGGEFGPA